MVYATAIFLAQAVVISLSGVMAPGPITLATVRAGARRRHAGAVIALGHAAVEFPLMGLIMGGAGAFLAAEGFRIGVGFAGGVVLLVLGGMMLASLRRPMEQAVAGRELSPFWMGVALSGGNPYFLLWWATVGLALATRAGALGVTAFCLFAVAHWLCDLVWLEVLSITSHRGMALLGAGGQKMVVVVCAGAMGVFGVWFLWDAARNLG